MSTTYAIVNVSRPWRTRPTVQMETVELARLVRLSMQDSRPTVREMPAAATGQAEPR